ncbi:MAG: polymer-forming cytoskeletal protein [Lachnospiraceae bacterium]|nr:polymer-forming cytoskeletal protein [Lachnospiraceae bacterium]
MFGTKRKGDTIGMINTIIGGNSKIEGLLTAAESTRIDGLLEGKIMSESSVIIGEHGLVRGDIDAVEILVAGTVYGNLRAQERIQLTETGRVLGDIFTKTLVIDEGASFKGQCTMDVKEDPDAKKGPDKTALSENGKKAEGAQEPVNAKGSAKDKNEGMKKNKEHPSSMKADAGSEES